MSEGNNSSFFDFIEDVKLKTELDNELGFVVFIANCSIENIELSSEKS
jgi:hypothetical protein